VRLRQNLYPAGVVGDVALLGRAVANLVDNAVRYNVPGGTVDVETGRDTDWSLVRVTNTGPDMSTVDIQPLFEPFHGGERTRLDGAGFGLGLSIVDAVARAHRGTVTAVGRCATDGGGLSVTVQLPADPDAAR